MITDALINAGYWVISTLISILPSGGDFPQTVHDASATLGSYWGMFDPIAPIGTVAACLTIVVTVEVAIFGWKSFKSIISHLPQIGGAGH